MEDSYANQILEALLSSSSMRSLCKVDAGFQVLHDTSGSQSRHQWSELEVSQWQTSLLNWRVCVYPPDSHFYHTLDKSGKLKFFMLIITSYSLCCHAEQVVLLPPYPKRNESAGQFVQSHQAMKGQRGILWEVCVPPHPQGQSPLRKSIKCTLCKE